MTEQQDLLLKRLKQGAEEAYHHLFKKYYRRLCAIAQFYVNDSFVAENIVSDLFFYMWEHREDIEINSLDSYLLRSVRNRCLNYLQQAMVRYETELPPNFSELSHYNEGTITPDSPLEQLLEKELEEKIRTAVKKLPEECRTVFEMSRYQQSSYDEIAQKLGLSVNTVRYHMKNALSRLRDNLKDYLTLLFL